MPYHYAHKTVFFNKILEYFAFVLLFPFRIFRRSKKNAVRKILLIEPFQMGDALSLCPMLEPLKRQYPEAKIFILTKHSSGAILQYDKRIEVLTTDFPWSDYGKKGFSIARFIKLFKYLWKIRREKFDIGVDTRGDIRSQIVLQMIQCSQIVGYRHYLGSNIRLKGLFLDKYLDASPYLHRYDWNNYLLTSLGISQELLYPAQIPCFFPITDEITTQTKFILLHVGGGWEYKRWQETKWVQLINQISKTVLVIVIGGKGEQTLVEQIKSQIPENPNIQYKITNFEEIIQLTKNCQFFIGLDSGPMNLAVCLGKPVISLFGPGDSSMWYPYTSHSQWIHKKEGFSCNPCFQTNCFFPQKSCMASIEVEEVYSMVNYALASL